MTNSFIVKGGGGKGSPNIGTAKKTSNKYNVDYRWEYMDGVDLVVELRKNALPGWTGIEENSFRWRVGARLLKIYIK